jgi:hypothetical protein
LLLRACLWKCEKFEFADRLHCRRQASRGHEYVPLTCIRGEASNVLAVVELPTDAEKLTRDPSGVRSSKALLSSVELLFTAHSSLRPFFLLLFLSLSLSPAFCKEISRLDLLETTIANSVDQLHPGFVLLMGVSLSSRYLPFHLSPSGYTKPFWQNASLPASLHCSMTPLPPPKQDPRQEHFLSASPLFLIEYGQFCAR